MSAPRLDVAEVFRQTGDEVFDTYPASIPHRRVVRDLVACRTAALGCHVRRCEECGHEEIAYNSCRNRHCPKCQGHKQAQWLEGQCRNLLPVEYYHLVFTLPEALSPLALQNPRVLYGLLFRAASETLLTIAADPKHLGAKIGFTAVLHTWGQTLMHHPHVHCVVPAGGLSPDGSRWIPSREGFFLPVRVLSRLFREKYLAFLRHAARDGLLLRTGRLEILQDPGAWQVFLESLRRTEWVVYAKPPFGSPEQVLKYLARYTHRVAISNQRLVAIDNGEVVFKYKDYRHGRRPRVMRLRTTEFARRFLLHVLPRSFVRIRHFGLLGNRAREAKLRQCRHLMSTVRPVTPAAEPVTRATEPARPPHTVCTVCHTGHVVVVGHYPPVRAGPRAAA